MLLQVMTNHFDKLAPFIDCPDSGQLVNDDHANDEYTNVQNEQTIILLQNGIYLIPRLLQFQAENIGKATFELYVLDSDYLASGLNAPNVIRADDDTSNFSKKVVTRQSIKLVNTQQWVLLCAAHDKVLTIQ